MAKTFKRTEFLRLKPFENEQKNTIPESGIVLNRKSKPLFSICFPFVVD